MTRLTQIAPENATGRTAELFATAKAKMGMVPNMLRALGNSPAALQSYLQFSGSLADGVLSAKEREQIALAVSQANQCDYCLSAHSALGKMAGLTQDQIRDARLASAVESKQDAMLGFVRKVVEERGKVSDNDIQALRQHQFDDAQIAEIVANVALNIFTNYFNHAAEPVIDFPKPASIDVSVA